MQQTKSLFWLTIRPVVLGCLMLAGPVLAHDGKTPIHYVAGDGTDTGDCAKPETRCATVGYALLQAEKGDEVRVAEGIYDFPLADPAETIQLLSPIVPVLGGYDAETFSERSIAETPTILRGPHADYALELEQRGLLLAQAQTGEAAQDTTLLSRGVTRYVISGGLVSGDCSEDTPCALDFALSIAETGDAVLIAGGDYVISTEEAEGLLRPDITVQGGYLEQEAFRAAAPQTRPSYITGPSFTERDALAARGLTLIQDRKTLSIENTILSGRATQSTAIQAATPCDRSTGMAGPYPCRGIDLLAQIPLGALSSQPGAANDIWGFVDQRDGREYALLGLLNGTAVINVTDPENPQEVGTVPGFNAQWRDIKVYQFLDDSGVWQAYAYVTADRPSSPQGLQIIDLAGLPSSVSLAATYRGFARAHNIYLSNVDFSTGVPRDGMEPFAFILGSDLAGGAAHALSLANPLSPTEVMRPLPGTQYAHDAATAVITDARTAACQSGLNPPPGGHNPCELLVDYNEDTVDLWDVTEKSRPLLLSSTTYPNASYTHSGWVSEDTRFVFVQDELDEQDRGLNTTLRVFDIGDLSAPVLAAIWTGPDTNIDHNGFVLGDRYYMSAYRRGLSVLDIADPGNPTEIAFFDTFPTPAANTAIFNGSWGVYPYLPSGTLLVSNIEDGLFVLREASKEHPEPRNGRPEIAYYEYPIKLVCGIQRDPESGQLVRGAYGTMINIANLGENAVTFTKDLALTVPPGRQEPGQTFRIGDDALEPTQALKTDCMDVIERVLGGNPPADAFEGFIVLRSSGPLEVRAVYAAGQLEEAGVRGGGDLDVETIAPRAVPKR